MPMNMGYRLAMRMWFLGLVLLVAAFMPSLVAAQPRCSSPQDAVSIWLGHLQPNRMDAAEASRCFAWRQAGIDDAKEQIRLTRALKEVYDHNGLIVDVEGMPGEEYNGDRFVVHHALPQVEVRRYGDKWLISAKSIERIDSLHGGIKMINWAKLAEKLPVWTQGGIAGLRIWQLMAVALVVLLGFLIRWMAALLVVRLAQRFISERGTRFDRALLERAAAPLGTLMMSFFYWHALLSIGFGVRVNQVFAIAIRSLGAFAVVWLLYRVVDFIADIFAKRAAKTDTKLDDQVVPLVRKSLKVVVVSVGLLFVLQNLDVDIGSLLAGASLGGLAFSLAAKDTVANLFGSFSIFTDRPFQIGDWVVIEGSEGIVEEVGMRSTRIRTFENSLISIPNSIVANSAVNNYGMRQFRRCRMVLGVTYDTSAEQLQAFVEGIRGVLEANTKVRKDFYEVNFNNFGDSSLEILVYFFFEVPDWSEELHARQHVLFEIMRLAEQLCVSFAFPTQSLHIESTPNESKRAHTPTPIEMKGIIEGFGPGGSQSRPVTAPIVEQSEKWGRSS